MKISIKKKHEYLSGWTTYDMTWKTDFETVRNKTFYSAVVASKEPFSTKTFKEWASEQGVDTNSIYSDINNYKGDVDKVKKLVDEFCKVYKKNLDELNSQNKCITKYTASLNRNIEPLKMAFDTIQVYNVRVLIEYKSAVIDMSFLSQGRKKNDFCPMFIFSGGETKQVYGEEEAIDKIKDRIETYLNDCDTDEKFSRLYKKLEDIQNQVYKEMGF